MTPSAKLKVMTVVGTRPEIIRLARVIDRSLDSTRFKTATGYAPKPWPEQVAAMRQFG